MKVVKPQPLLVSFSPTQWGSQAFMCLAVGVGFRLSDPRILVHEASVWEALNKSPTSVPLSESGMPKERAEWLMAGHTQSIFKNEDIGYMCDWTAKVRIDTSIKKISAQALVKQTTNDCPLAMLSVDYCQSAKGGKLVSKPLNPVGYEGDAPPLQRLAWHGPQSDPFAAMSPIDSSWPERAQWMPKFKSDLEAMSLDGSHMGWPQNTDKRFFQQSAPDQWHTDNIWPSGASYELLGFGNNGIGYEGNLPLLTPQMIVVKGEKNESVNLIQQTIWLLPDQDLAVMWWTGSVQLKHPLDDILKMMVVALSDNNKIKTTSEIMSFADSRCDLIKPNLTSMSDIPLLPCLSNGWVWELITNDDDHPRDRVTNMNHHELYIKIKEEEDQLCKAQQQINESLIDKDFMCNPGNFEKNISLIWLLNNNLNSKKLIDNELIKNQLIENHKFIDIYFESLIFQFCNFNNIIFENCNFKAIDFKNCDLSNTTFINCNFLTSSFECINSKIILFKNNILNQVRFEKSNFKNLDFIEGNFTNIIMSNSFFNNVTMNHVKTDNLSILECSFDRFNLYNCVHEKISFIKTKLNKSNWENIQLSKSVFVENTEIKNSLWKNCISLNMCWIGINADKSELNNCTFTNLNAQSSSLRKTSWKLCIVNDAQFLNADMRDSFFDKTSLKGAFLSGAQLQNSEVNNSNIIKINTSNAIHSDDELWKKNLNYGAIMYPKAK